ncbi:MAG: tetratricopeptide repeat protein [Verrucomicrobiota bacterium]
MPADFEQSNASGHHARRAWQLLELHRPEEAAEAFRESLAANPENEESHFGLAQCLAKGDYFSDALREVETAIRIEPTIAVLHAYRALLLSDTRQPKPARQSIKTALELEPENAYCWRCSALVEKANANLKKAEQDLRKALELDPRSVTDRNLLVPLMNQKGRFAESREVLEEALKLEPENPNTHSQLGWILLPTDRERAENHFYTALRLNPHLDEARKGMLEAFKGRNWIYRTHLRFDYNLRNCFTERNLAYFLVGIIFGGFLFYFLLPVDLLRLALDGLLYGIFGIILLVAVSAVFGVLRYHVGSLMVLADRKARLALTLKEKINAALITVFLGGPALLAVYALIWRYLF